MPITILIAAKNEAVNLPRCLSSVSGKGCRVILLDSHSTDNSSIVASTYGAEVIQFTYSGGYPKKRQWALDNLDISTEWILFLDADEVVPLELWEEISTAISSPNAPNGFLITKGFHFLGRRFRWGGFSFAAVLLIRKGKARFEQILEEVGDGLDMEVHERVIVDGPVGRLQTPLIHEDFKGLKAYLDRHNRYSTWEAVLRYRFLQTGTYGKDTIRPRLFGNTQERRRWIKKWIIRLPFEATIWFIYHYFLRLGFLEGRPGLIAAQIRASYIQQVRAKIYELQLREQAQSVSSALPQDSQEKPH